MAKRIAPSEFKRRYKVGDFLEGSDRRVHKITAIGRDKFLSVTWPDYEESAQRISHIHGWKKIKMPDFWVDYTGSIEKTIDMMNLPLPGIGDTITVEQIPYRVMHVENVNGTKYKFKLERLDNESSKRS